MIPRHKLLRASLLCFLLTLVVVVLACYGCAARTTKVALNTADLCTAVARVQQTIPANADEQQQTTRAYLSRVAIVARCQ